MKKVLTSTELQNLRKVYATKKQARTIKRRNTNLLKFLDSLPTTLEDCKKYVKAGYYSSNIGCPHCDYNYDIWMHYCNTCKWKQYPSTHKRAQCCYATFGGICLNDIQSYSQVTVSYSHNDEKIDVYFLNIGIYNSKNLPRDFKVYLKQLKNCKRFCQGHIEWADAILNKSN